MQEVLRYAAVVAIDPVSELKLPCMLVGGMPYYVKLRLLCGVPILVSVAVVVFAFCGHLGRAHYQHRRAVTRRKKQGMMRRMNGIDVDAVGEAVRLAQEYKARMREGAHRGLYLAASIVTYLMDLLFPTVSRTILQIFRCRQLGDPAQGGGFFLEADYSLACYGEEWKENVVLAGCATVVYCFGYPFSVWLAIRTFKKRGMLEDPDVNYIFGWMHKPFRDGCE